MFGFWINAINHQLSTINSQPWTLNLALESLPKNHPDPSSPTKGHPSGGGEYPVVLRQWGNDTPYFLFSTETNCAFKILHLVSWISYLFSFLFSLCSTKKTPHYFPSKVSTHAYSPPLEGWHYGRAGMTGWLIWWRCKQYALCRVLSTAINLFTGLQVHKFTEFLSRILEILLILICIHS